MNFRDLLYNKILKRKHEYNITLINYLYIAYVFRATCKPCGKIVSYANRGTSSMKYHAEKFHGIKFEDPENVQLFANCSKSFLFQSIGIAIQRGNASCVMGTTGSMGKLKELNI